MSRSATTRPSRFARIAGTCHDRRRWVLGGWVAVLVLVGIVSGAVGGDFRDEFNLPDVESKRGFDILDEHVRRPGHRHHRHDRLPGRAGRRRPRGRGGDEGAVRPRWRRSTTSPGSQSPYAEEGEQQISSTGAEAGKIAYANVEMPDDIAFDRAAEIRDEILDEQPAIDGLQIELGGFIFAEFEEPSSEILGLAFAIVILILAFGSVLAMGLPVGVALFGIGIGTALITLLSNVLTVPDFATFLGIMIGLGVGIDYALLIVTRYREQLHAGHTVRESIGIAIDTAGRSVLFAGITVVISLLGMLLMGVSLRAGPGRRRRVGGGRHRASRRSRCCRRCSASPASGSSAPAGAA